MTWRQIRSKTLASGVLVLSCLAAIPAAIQPPPALIGDERDSVLLFSYFTGHGEDGLHLARSEDGHKWTPLRKGASFLAPAVGSKLMRDPSVVQGPDGTFHMVWTTGWWERGIGVAHSKDLLTWSEQRWLPVMAHEPTAHNCWAPELFYDAATQEFLIVWATTIPGRFPATDNTGEPGGERRLNHRLYCVTTRDFKTLSPTRLFYDGGFSAIDAVIAHTGSQYVMVLKDETRQPVAKKHLRVAFSDRAAGPYGPASPPISVDWVEGPSIVRLNGDWVVYYDEYTRRRYGAIRSGDLKVWRNISDRVSFPEGTRHGTAFRVPGRIAAALGR
jgi:hypothetical protein